MIRRAAAGAVVVLVLGLALAAGVSTAGAQTVTAPPPISPTPVAQPGWWANQTPIDRKIIESWAYRGTGHPAPYGVDEVPKATVDKMVASEMDEVGNRSNAQRYASSKLRSSAGLARGAGAALSRFSLIAGTFTAGYAIGTGINRLVGQVAHGGKAAAGEFTSGQAMEFYSGTTVPFGESGLNRIDELPGVPAGEGAYIFQYVNPGGVHHAARPQAPSSHWVNAPPAGLRRFSYSTTDPPGYEKRIVGYSTVQDTIPRIFSSAPGTHPETTDYPTIEPTPIQNAGTTAQTRSDRLGQELEKAENEPLRRWAESQTGQNVADPYSPNSTVPSYSGEVWTSYQTKAQGAGFTDINRVIVPDGGADLTQPKGAVLEVSPAAGSEVAKDSRLTVTTNPDVMPLAVPAALPGEVFTKYVQRLDPKLRERVDEEVLTDPDLNVGPDGVSSTLPAAGTVVNPETDPAFRLRVRRNPSSAPAPGGGGGSCGLTPPAAALNFGPITNAKLGNKVPFSLVGFLGGATSGIVTASARPNAGFSVLGVESDLRMLGDLDPAIGAFRLALAFLMWLGVGWFLYGRTIGRDT